MNVYVHIVFLFLSTGFSFSDNVHQNPPNMYKNPEEKAKITCSHNITPKVILWYKQLKNRQIQFLGHMVDKRGFLLKGLDEDVTIDGDANKDQNCTLTINSVSVSSSAVYFCAASYHSATYH
uniref:Immunoglobulin V-set domain-containing protein n=1 Tax=Stegastes partitus TaxID=144197 RepID=A0A3B5BJW5_9TELE